VAKKIKFTKTALERLPLPATGKRSTYYDVTVPKLALRVTSAGSKTFYIVRRTGHEMVWFKLGTFPDMTVEQSQRTAEKVLGAFAGESNPAVARRAAKGVPTLAEFFKKYGMRYGQYKKSWRDDQQRYRDYLDKPLGNRKLHTIGKEMVGRILADMDADGKAGSTVNNVRALASSLFSKAIEWNDLSVNPVKGIPTRKTNKRDRFIQSNELPRFFTSLADEANITIRDYFLLSLLTGARRANVLAMRWRDVNLQEGIWRIPVTKTGDPQNVTLSPDAITVLQQREEAKDDSPFVFPGGGKTGHLVEPKAGWKRIFDRDELRQLTDAIVAAGGNFPVKEGEAPANTLNRARNTAERLKVVTEDYRLDNLRIHDLRRTLGSWQAKTGASLVVIGKSLNHKNQATTAIYARLDLDPVRASVNTATAAMLEAGGLKPPPKRDKS